MTATITVQTTKQQSDFIGDHSVRKAFSGNRACGKTTAGAIDLLLRSEPGKRYAVFSPTFRMSEAATMRTFREVATKMGLYDPAKEHVSNRTIELTNGAIVYFLSADARSLVPAWHWDGEWIDDPEHLDASVGHDIILRCPDGWITMTFTTQPKKFSEWSGKMESHWTDNVTEDWFRARATLRDNVFISRDVIDQFERSWPQEKTP